VALSVPSEGGDREHRDVAAQGWRQRPVSVGGRR
jgi:hypothetical protein